MFLGWGRAFSPAAGREAAAVHSRVISLSHGLQVMSDVHESRVMRMTLWPCVRVMSCKPQKHTHNLLLAWQSRGGRRRCMCMLSSGGNTSADKVRYMCAFDQGIIIIIIITLCPVITAIVHSALQWEVLLACHCCL